MNAAAAVERLLALGPDGSHPASAIAGVRTAAGTTVAEGGWARLPSAGQPGAPMTRQTLLDLASVTKVAVTTTLVMCLVAEGQLCLETPAHRFLPSFTDAEDGKDTITVEHLLTHTAGLRPWWPLYYSATDDPDAALACVQQLPLATRPGTAWSYSDLGFMLAGRIIECVTTLGLADAFRQLVAEPLGLTARYGPVPAAQAAASADSDAYEYGMIAAGSPYPVPFDAEQFPGWRNRSPRGEVNDGNAAHALGGVSGHAGLFATVDDLLRLGAAVGGGDFIPSGVLARFAASVPVHPEQAVGFRRVSTRAGTLLYHSGFTGTYFAFGLADELVIAGGAMRLYGTLGLIPDRGEPPDVSRVVPTADIQSVLLDAAVAAFGQPSASTHAIHGEEK